MSQPLAGKVAIVTGAGRGLGRNMAQALNEAGARVVVAARTAEELNSFVAEAEAQGLEALAVPTDVTDEQAVERLVDKAIEAYGQIDIVLNNSGILDTVPLSVSNWWGLTLP